MIRDLISSLLDRWANLHPFIRFLAVAVLASLVGLVTMKPSYRAFKQWRMDRNLVAAHRAVDETRMQEARDLSLTVLRSGNPNIEAFRILEKSTAALGDPRHSEIARALISHPEGTDEDRLTGFLAVVMDMPLGQVGHAWNSLPEECRTQPEFATAFARRLLAGKRLAEAVKVLLNVPDDARDDGVRQALARVLIASGRSEGYGEAQRMIASGLEEGGSAVSGWLDVLEEVPVVSLQESLLAPLRGRLEDAWPDVDPARIGLIRVRMDYAQQWPERARILEGAIATWRDESPELLARFLGNLGLDSLLLETFSSEQIDSHPDLLPLALEAARRSAAWDRASSLLEAHGEHLPKSLELAYRALLTAKTADAAARSQACRDAIAEARTDPTNHALLTLQRMAGEAHLGELADMAMVEAIRAGRGPLPLYDELKPLYQSLAQSGQETTLLEICALYLGYEPSNPVLLTQYAYLACLLDVIEPAMLLTPLKLLAKAFPDELPIHITLATALLCDNQPAKAAEVLEPFELADKELAPAFRIVFLTSQVLSGKIPDNDPQIASFPWSSLQASENRKFSALIRSVR